MDLLAADNVTFTHFLNANWGTISAMLVGLGMGLSGAAAWFARVVWVRIEQYCERRDKREAATAQKGDSLIDTLTENTPKQTALLTKLTDTQTAIVEDMKEGRRNDDTVMQEVRRTKDAAIELSFGMEELAVDKEARERVENYTKRARERLDYIKSKVQKPEE